MSNSFWWEPMRPATRASEYGRALAEVPVGHHPCACCLSGCLLFIIYSYLKPVRLCQVKQVHFSGIGVFSKGNVE